MKKIFTLLGICALVGACGTTTPQGRIEANPGKFAALPAKHKPLVERGQIDRGMDKDAVLLAWGTPASRFEGYDNKRRTERWDYAGTRPTMTNSFYGGYYDYWGYGRRYYPYGHIYAVAPEVVYVPYTRATVSFVGGKVDSWERLK